MCGDQTSNKKSDYFPAEFEFFPPNHSVARAEAGLPCRPYESTGYNKVGFFSGFHFLEQFPERVSDRIKIETDGVLMIK